MRPCHELDTVLYTLGEAEINVLPGSHWLVVKLETQTSNLELRQHVANNVTRGANNVCGVGVSSSIFPEEVFVEEPREVQ